MSIAIVCYFFLFAATTADSCVPSALKCNQAGCTEIPYFQKQHDISPYAVHYYKPNTDMPNLENCEFGNNTFYCGCEKGVSAPDQCRVFFITDDEQAFNDDVSLQKRMYHAAARQGTQMYHETIVEREEHFNDWDYQLSPVVPRGTTVSVSRGKIVTNKISVSGGVDWKVSEALTAKFGVSWDKSWSNSDSVGLSNRCKSNYCVWEVNRDTHRIYGTIITRNGFGREMSRHDFMADKFFDSEDHSFVSGEYCFLNHCRRPIPFRYGHGEHR